MRIFARRGTDLHDARIHELNKKLRFTGVAVIKRWFRRYEVDYNREVKNYPFAIVFRNLRETQHKTHSVHRSLDEAEVRLVELGLVEPVRACQ